MVSLTPSDTYPKVILLRGSMTPASERPAGETITPGHTLAVNSDGEYIKHATAGGPGAPVVARENSIIGADIDDNYASGENVLAWHLRSGDWFYGFLEDNADVVVGQLLEQNGAGAFQAVSAGTAVVRALEAKGEAGVSGPYRIKLEVL